MTREELRPAPVTAAEPSQALWMFFGIAYAFTWLLELPVVLSDDGLGWLPFRPSDGPLLYLLLIAGTFGPTVAAVVTLRATAGPGAVRDLLRRCVQWRVPVRWYLVATAGVLAVGIGAAFLIPGTAEHFTASAGLVVMLVVLLLTFQLVVGALGEEPGWRGFALPRLQRRYGPLGGSAVLGLLWGGWHLPLFLVPEWVEDKGGANVGTVGLYLLFTVALSVVMAWVFNNVGGSVLLMILFHSAVNTSGNGVAEMFPGSDVVDHGILRPWVLGFGVAAVAVAAATRGRLSYRVTRP